MARIDDQLAKIAAELKQSKPSPEISVRDMLSWVEAARRGYYVVLTINEALRRAGLVTMKWTP